MSNVIPFNRDQPTDQELFMEGMVMIDDALSRIMEIKNDRCRIITQMLHSALLIGESVNIGDLDGQINSVDER